MVAMIANGEGGLSVRTKLNEALTRAALHAPASRIWGQIGDSRCQLGGVMINGSGQTAVGQNVVSRNTGVQFWAPFLSGQRVQFPQALNHGIGGETTAQIAARVGPAVSAAAAANADGMLVFAGRNSWSTGATFASVQADYETIVSTCLAAGLAVIWITDTPYGHATFTSARLTAPQLRRALQFRRWLLDTQAGRAGVIIIDGWDGLADPASTLGDFASAAFTVDGIHLSQQGSAVIGQRIAHALSAIYPPLSGLLPASNSDLQDAVDNPRGVISANPFFAGTTGTSLSTNGSGTLAANWAPRHNGARAGYTVVFSQPTVGGKAWQQLVYSGTPTLAGQHDGIMQALSLGTQIAAGARVRVMAEVEWDAGLTGVSAISIGIEGNRTNAPGFYLAYDGQDNATSISVGTAARSGILMSDPITVPADATSLELRIRHNLIANTALAATIRWRAAGIVLLP